MTGKRLWRSVKAVLVLAVLGWVATVFACLLHGLEGVAIIWDVPRLVAAGLFYLAGLLPSAVYWWWAMRRLHQHPGPLQALRAYLIGHLGKYIPGKALVVVLRTALVRGPRVSIAAAVFAVVLETLTCMASGGLIAVVLMLADRSLAGEVMVGMSSASFLSGREWLVHAVMLAAVVLTLPWVFNFVARRVAAPFRRWDARHLPPLDWLVVFGGLLLGGISWFFLGASLFCVLGGIQEIPWSAGNICYCTVYIAIAAVLAFWTPMPGGLGVREVVLLALLAGVFPVELAAEHRAGLAALAALLLRLTWMAVELLLAAILYPLPVLSSLKTNAGPPTEQAML